MLVGNMNAKQRAAQAALAFVSSGMVLGLGTGSTADFFLLALGDALANGKLRNIRAIPTSRRSQIRAAELAIPLIDFGNCPRADLTIDGADEISPSLDLIKGLGGAFARRSSPRTRPGSS